MKYKTEWDLGLIYKNYSKELVEKDLSKIKSEYTKFAKKYRTSKKHLKNPKDLRKALEESEKLSKNISGERPYFYYAYRKELNGLDSEAEAELSKLSEFFANLANQVEFFALEIAKVPKNTQARFLKSKELLPFRYFLKKLFENAKHNLTEPEEKILNLKSNTSRGMWISGFSKILSKQMIEVDSKEIPLSEAMNNYRNFETKKRREVYKKINDAFYKISDFAESEINAIVTDKKINDFLKKFKTPEEATIKGYENDPRTVKTLVESVNSKVAIAHRFYKIKAEILGEKTLRYADRAAKIGDPKTKIKLDEAIERVTKSFNSASNEFGTYVKDMFLNGQVDVYPKRGKHSGAFCSSSATLPTYVLLNHTDDFNSLTTLAHEMGHALHSKYSKSQRPIYEDYTIAVAEVASTFFENLVFEDALSNITEEERMVILHDKIQDDINTIFRQIACFNFELELHNTIRKEGFLQKEKIAEIMNKHMQNYLGPTFELTTEDGYFFVTWSHIRNFFYVYSYAFGQLISDALYERYKKDKKNVQDVIKFLSAGGSDTPENIFKSIGIKVDKNLFETGLKRVEKNIEELETLWNKIKKNEKNNK